MQVQVVDVIQAVAEVKNRHRHRGGGRTTFDWPDVHAVLIKKFGVESMDELCLRLPGGLGYPVTLCVERWKAEKKEREEQLREECRR
jgi:hypothetical protein